MLVRESSPRLARLFSALALGCAFGVASASALVIDIVPGTGLAANQDALDAFNRAAAEWTSAITDPITVTINADLSSTAFSDPRIIGSTSSVDLQDSYDVVVGQLKTHSNAAIIQSLPSSTQFNATTPTGVTLSGNLTSTKADFKAMGYAGLDMQFGVSDASITFNSNYTFYYGPNGTTTLAGNTDFQTVAAHEIGHALGFFSSVDVVDTTTVTTLTPTTLDLYRFTQAGAPTTSGAFTLATRNLVPNTTDVTSDTLTSLLMSTGHDMGDGNQASHWKADELNGNTLIGIMDPTLANGVQEFVNNNDLRAMQLIGYDVVPEPGGFVLCVLLGGAGCCLLIGRAPSGAWSADSR